MEITGSSAYHLGASASASQSSDVQVERLRAVDLAKAEVEPSVKPAKASDEMLGRFIDTFA
ncbi:hypothetical protein [Pseudomonas putida]